EGVVLLGQADTDGAGEELRHLHPRDGVPRTVDARRGAVADVALPQVVDRRHGIRTEAGRGRYARRRTGDIGEVLRGDGEREAANEQEQGEDEREQVPPAHEPGPGETDRLDRYSDLHCANLLTE